MRVILTANAGDGALVVYGLNNGAVGTVVAMLYPPGEGPPSAPDAVVVDFPSYRGPR